METKSPRYDDPEPSALEEKNREVAELRDALQKAEDKYRILIENANDAIFVLQDGKIRFANPKALELGDVLAEDLSKVPFTEYLHPNERELVVQRHEKRLKGEKILNMYPLRIITRAGNLFWAEVNAVRIEWEGRPATLNIIRDITSQKLIEQHYFQSENLNNLRTLAGGLAHSFNNLLMGIQGRVSLLQRSISLKDMRRQHLNGIESCVEDAAKLTQQMLGFAQSGKYYVTQLKLNDMIRHMVKACSLDQKQVTVAHELQAGLWRVEADRFQIEQALTNILLNALQSIPGKGLVTVKTENFELSEGREHHEDVRTGKCVRITFRDNGVGMDDTICKRSFEPFFTTKGIGRHRGLGLSSAYGIIANHDGLIDIESTPGTGTTVSVYLPAHDDA